MKTVAVFGQPELSVCNYIIDDECYVQILHANTNGMPLESVGECSG